MATGDSQKYEEYVKFINNYFDVSATGGYAPTYYTKSHDTSVDYYPPPKLHENYDIEIPEELL